MIVVLMTMVPLGLSWYVRLLESGSQDFGENWSIMAQKWTFWDFAENRL